MKNFFGFIFSKAMIINLLLAGVVIGGAIFATLNYIDGYTLHGETVTVPDFTGYTLAELDTFVVDKKVRYEVSEYTYNRKKPRGTVLDQIPKPDAQVKDGRKIYLTINSNEAPKKQVPELLDVTTRIAVSKLKAEGFEIGDFIYKPAYCDDCVVGLQQDGEDIESGTKLEKGSIIDIVVGQTESNEKVGIPELTGLNLEETKTKLSDDGLNIGAVVFTNCENEADSAASKVYRQIPAYEEGEAIQLGSTIKVFLKVATAKADTIK